MMMKSATTGNVAVSKVNVYDEGCTIHYSHVTVHHIWMQPGTYNRMYRTGI